MITINLLPKDMQVEEHSSPTNLIVRVASLLVAFVALVIFVVFRFIILDKAKDIYTEAENQRNELKKYEQENKDLTTIIERFKKRDNTVETVRNLRVPFSQKLWQFSDVLYRKNYPIWITNLIISPDKKSAAPVKGKAAATQEKTLATFKWTMDCVCASPKLEPTTNFYDEIKNDRKFFRDFGGITLINSFTKMEFGKEYQPSFGWNFALNLRMEVKPPEKPKDPSFKAEHFKNPHNFLIKIRDAKDPFTQYLRENLGKDFKDQLVQYTQSPPPQPLIVSLIGEFNKLLKKDLYDKQRVANLKLKQEIHNLFQSNPQGDELVRANRILLEEAYSNEISKH